MRDRGLLLVLLAGALTFLASLYLPWDEVQASQVSGAGASGVTGLLNLFGGEELSLDGWSTFGQPAGLLALALVAGAALAVFRPRLAGRLPLGSCALGLGFFAVLAMFEQRDIARFLASYAHATAYVAYGSYLALTSATVVCVCAIVLRRNEPGARLSATAVAAAALTGGLLAAFLAPYLTFHGPPAPPSAAMGYQLAFYDTLPIFTAGIACLSLPLWGLGRGSRARLAVALSLAVLASAPPVDSGFHGPWEMWLVLGCSLGLLALALVTGRVLRIGAPSIADAAALVAGALLLVSLFLPWQKAGPAHGWSVTVAATAGGLATVLLAVLLATARFSGALAAAAAVYVVAAGFEVTQFSRLEYGAPLGFAGAALLLLPILRLVRLVDATRLLARLLPILACAGFLAVPVVALPKSFSLWWVLESPWHIYWLEVAAIVAALLLLGCWLTARPDDPALLLLPLVLLALTALDLVELRGEGISWLGIASVGLCLLLAALAWLERNGGLDRLQIPEEIWRVDRLPPVED